MRNFLSYVLFILILHPLSFIIVVGGERPERVLTLSESVKLALSNSAPLLSAAEDIRIAEFRKSEALFAFYPQFGFSLGATKFRALRSFILPPEFSSLILNPEDPDLLYSGRFSVRQALYAGGRNFNAYWLAQSALDLAKAKKEAIFNETRYQAKQAFFELLWMGEQRTRTREVLEDLKELGDGVGVSAFKAEAILSRWRALAARFLREEKKAKLRFLQAMGLEFSARCVLSGALETKPLLLELPKALAWAREFRPELKAEEYQSQLNALELKRALGQRSPMITLGADYELLDFQFPLSGREFPLRTNNWMAGLHIHVPLSYSIWTQIKQRRAQQVQGQYQRAQVIDRIEKEVRDSFEDMNYWWEEVQRRGQDKEKIHKKWELLKKKNLPFSGGIEIQWEIFQSELAVLEAIYTHLQAKGALEKAVGKELE